MLESPSSSRNGSTTTLDREDDRVPFNPGPWTGPQSRRMDDDDYVAPQPQRQAPDVGNKNTAWEKCDDLPQRSSSHSIPSSFPLESDFHNFFLGLREGGEVYHFGINPNGIRVIGLKENCELMLQALDWIAQSNIQRDGLTLPDFIRDSQLRTLITAKLNPPFPGGQTGGIAPISQVENGELYSYGIIGVNPEQELGGIILTVCHECDHLRGFNHDVMDGRDQKQMRDLERSGISREMMRPW